MKKIIIFTICAVMALSFIGCTAQEQKDAEQGSIGENVQIINPFENYDSIEEAAKDLGFDVKAPESACGKKLSSVSASTAERGGYDMIELLYGEDNELCIRKGKGSDDISGDYSEYTEVTKVNFADKDITLKGDDGKVYTAIWTDGEFSYSIYAESGISADEMSSLAAEIG